MPKLRPLPAAILLMTLLAGVKMIGLVEAVGIGAPARANIAEHDAKPAVEAKPKLSATPAPLPAVTPSCPPVEQPVSDAERTALQDLRERRKQLDSRAAKLDDREALLSAAETSLTDRVQQLTSLQARLEQLDKERHDRDEANWKGLVRTYEAMKPRDAAAIFNDIDNAIMVQVLDRMKEAKAAAILADMTPERARVATTQLAKWRNQVNAAPHLDLAGAKP